MIVTFLPTTFDKSFTKAVQYLLKEGIATSQRALAFEFQLTAQGLNAILQGYRGVPRDKRQLITFVLTSEKYGVSKRFLETARGSILADPLPVDGSAHPQYDELVAQVNMLKMELENLKLQLHDKDQLIATQQLLIDRLQQ
jgi:hypothetical protein